MTQQEIEYMERALEVLRCPYASQMARHKILKTLAQICDKAAREIEFEVGEIIELRMEHNRLVDILKK